MGKVNKISLKQFNQNVLLNPVRTLILLFGLVQIFSSNLVLAQSGAALNFDGVNDYLDLGASLGNFGTGNFTFETWFKTTGTGDRSIVSKRAGCNASNFWNLRMINGALYYEVCGNGSQVNLLTVQSPLATYNDGNWHHVACTKNTNVYTLYVDGVQLAQGATGTTSYSNAIALMIGGGPCGNFVGTLDETRMWNVARSSYEIQSKYTCEISGPQTGLLAAFHYNQGIAAGANAAITAATDASGNNNNGTLTGFALTGAGSNWVNPGAISSGLACTADPLPAFQLTGNGGQGWLGGECYQLTANQQALFGSMWSRKKVDLTQDFDMSANLNFGTNNSPGADGITFAFQNLCTSAGSAGQDIGVGGVTPSFVVEFDTYQNGVYGDPAADHIAIQKNGDLNHGGGNALVAPVQIDPANVNVETGADYLVRILWTRADSSLKVYVNGNLRTSYSGNIITQLFGGNPYVYWGFTAGTGGEFNVQKVCVTTMPTNVVSLLSNASICAGTGYQANVPGYSSYSWLPTTGINNPTIGNPILTPITNTVYTLTVTDACNNQQTQTINITVNQIPLVTAGGTATVCAGTGTPLSASGAASFSWLPATGLNDTSSANPTATPASTTTYTVTGTSNGCRATATVTITVNTVSVTQATGASTFCAGGNATIHASGAATYLWAPAASLDNATSANPIATPAQTTTYTVTGSAGGCYSTATVTITVNPIPTVSVSSPTICYGQQATLVPTVSPSGGVYVWSNGSFNSTLSISPLVQTIYGLTYEVGGCSNTANGTVTVNPVPLANAGVGGVICPGAILSLSASGGTSFSWSPPDGLSVSNVNNPNASPAVTTTYTVTVGNSFTCTTMDTVTVHVIPLAVNAGTDGSIVCGTPVNLNGSGATNYSWSPAQTLTNAGIANPTANPTVTTNYILTGSNGVCSATDTVVITVLGLTANAGTNVLICAGQSTQLTSTVTASNGIYQDVHSGYNFTNSLGSYGSITGGTVLWNSSSATMDDVVSGAITIPAFTFNNQVYTSIYVSSNGFITFGSASIATNYTPLSSAQNYAGCVSAFGADLGAYSSFNSEVRYQLIGSQFIVQWKNVGRYNTSNTVDEELSFQIILNTSNNQIAIIYSSVAINGTSLTYPQVGLRGPNNTFAVNVNNRTIALNGGSWTTNTTVGTSNTSTCALSGFSGSTKPQNGTVFFWTPQTFLQSFYSWTPNGDLNNATIANPMATPSLTTTYTLSVNYGSCAATSTVIVIVDPCLGIKNADEKEAVSLFPNPANSLMNISFDAVNEKEMLLIVTDLAGKIVYTQSQQLNKGKNKFAMDVRNLASGLYFLEMKAEQAVRVEKIRIQH